MLNAPIAVSQKNLNINLLPKILWKKKVPINIIFYSFSVSGPVAGPQLLSALGSLTSPMQMVPGHPATHDLHHNSGTFLQWYFWDEVTSLVNVIN